jgi:hypothetical protein
MTTIIVILKRPNELTGYGKLPLIPYLEQTVKSYGFLLSKKPPVLNQLFLFYFLTRDNGVALFAFLFAVKLHSN